jgi:tRNA threonylcarbamoyladenosine biosynthesis protein TsaB
MVKSTLSAANLSLKDIEAFAISAGPGSFTGIRIGIAAVKGLAIKDNVNCVSVSTLEAMAEQFKFQNAVICAVMDARCNQVYNAIFEIKNGSINRLCDDRALLCNELAEEIKELSQNGSDIIIMGDGADMFYPFVEDINNTVLAKENVRYQNAIGVAFAANELFDKGEVISPEKLLPIYLRLPQAERELKLKKEQEK